MVGVYDIKHWCNTLSNECIRFQPANNTHKYLGVKSCVSSLSDDIKLWKLKKHTQPSLLVCLSVCDGDTNSEQYIQIVYKNCITFK